VKLPVLGLQPWLSELKHIREGCSFVDEQKIGPYKLWYHYHGIEEVPEGVRFVDRIAYEVPFGIIGRIAHGLFIKRTLERIFDYREQRLKELLTAG
jgi:ligand-binding SRPBCC domain-containing protein